MSVDDTIRAAHRFSPVCGAVMPRTNPPGMFTCALPAGHAEEWHNTGKGICGDPNAHCSWRDDAPVAQPTSDQRRELRDAVSDIEQLEAALSSATVRCVSLTTERNAARLDAQAADALRALSEEARDRWRGQVHELTAERDALREREPSDAEKLKAHLGGCAECSAGDYCDEGESYGGDVTRAYLYRITLSNGCKVLAVRERIAAYRAACSEVRA